MEKNHNTCDKIVCSVNKDSAKRKESSQNGDHASCKDSLHELYYCVYNNLVPATTSHVPSPTDRLMISSSLKSTAKNQFLFSS